MMVVAMPRRPHCFAAKNEMARPIATRAIPNAAPVVNAGWRAMIPAATAIAPNDMSTLIASDPVSRLASAWSRSASCAVSLPSSTSRVMSRTILMAGLLPLSYPSQPASVQGTPLRMRRNRLPDRQRVRGRGGPGLFTLRDAFPMALRGVASLPGSSAAGGISMRSPRRNPYSPIWRASAQACRTARTGRRSPLASDRRALLRCRRLCGVELPVPLLDAASPLVPGDRGADMIRRTRS
jgi:hypothetical protein